jgi:hypothetical protein
VVLEKLLKRPALLTRLIQQALPHGGSEVPLAHCVASR